MKTVKESGSSTVRQKICFVAFIVFLISAYSSIPVSAQQKPSRLSSLEAFSKGDYELAYKEFSELLASYPRDPLYKYYSARCLINLKRDPEQAVTLLQGAKQGTSVVRNIPFDVVFWLGRAQQLAGSFEDAIDSYNIYTEQSGRKTAKDLGVPQFIQECSEKKGNLDKSEAEVLPAKVEKDIVKPVVNKDSAKGQNLPARAVRTTRETINEDYDNLLSEALQFQVRADSLQKIIESQKNSLEKLSYREKTVLRTKIAETENLADSLQNQADIKFAEAQAIMNKTSFAEIKVPKDTTRKSEVSVKKDTVKSVRKEVVSQKKDSISQAPAIKEPLKAPEKKLVKDTSSVETKKVATSQAAKQASVFSYFEIIPKPVFKPNEKVKVNPEIPPGLIYRIQTAVFRNPVAPSYFKGISPVFGFKSSSSGLTIYYAGMFRRLADAKKALAAVKQKGFKDAFVTSFFAGKTVSAERAAVLEKEWGKKPFTSITSAAPEAPADTIPPALTFRVEVMRSAKPVKDDVVEDLRKTAGTRGLETVKLDNGTMVFLIGTFITYESAEEYADLLVKNGYRGSKVAAWLGKKEIPVETARELFDRLK